MALQSTIHIHSREMSSPASVLRISNRAPGCPVTPSQAICPGTPCLKLFLVLVWGSLIGTAPLYPQWPMAGANPQRTSWVPEQVPDAATIARNGNGNLFAQWYRPVEAYIPGRVQVIAAHNLLYLSTAKGLYAFNEDGTLAWVYRTSLPLGHSPTIDGDVAYVGCFDGRIHAVNALTGELIAVSPMAQAGFQTNPLVVDGVTYAGNRDGRLYAWVLGENDWKWQFPAAGEPPLNGPVLFSSAYDPESGAIYFAANDGYAYSVSKDGNLIWKTGQLPGEGFRSWWPVVHGDAVIFSGSDARRYDLAPTVGEPDLFGLQQQFFFGKGLPKGTLRSPRNSDGWLDTSRANVIAQGTIPSTSDYFEQYPENRTSFVLNKSDGNEFKYDFDGDGKTEFSPVLWWGTHNGNRYPPLVGADGNFYQTNAYYSDDWIPGGHISGWRLHTPYVNTPVSRWLATDEPVAYSGGGNLLYWNHCCDRSGGAADLSKPNNSFPASSDTREWWYYSYNLRELLPGYDVMTGDPIRSPYSGLVDCPGPYGGQNGVYHSHSAEQNPPIPYHGQLYSHRSNALLAFGSSQTVPKSLPLVVAPASLTPSVEMSQDALEARLADEIEKILTAGHLRPGWGHHGLLDNALDNTCGDQLEDYWHHPADIHIALLQALPHVSAELQSKIKVYLQNEMADFPVYKYTTIGWEKGASRESFGVSIEPLVSQSSSNAKDSSSERFAGWTRVSDGGLRTPPYLFYALWKYAEVIGGAKELFEQSRQQLAKAPGDDVLAQYPFVHNAFVAGYLGYLQLEKLAGYSKSEWVEAELQRLLTLRAETFTADTPYTSEPIHTTEGYCRALTVSRNFIFMVPELAEYLRLNARNKVATAVTEYERVAPYWFVAFNEGGMGEGTLSPLYDRLLFLAKAWILGEPRAQLAGYLDVPGFSVGDLFYIQALTAAIEAPVATSDAVGNIQSDSSVPLSRDGGGLTQR